MRVHHTKVHGEPLPNRTCAECGERFYDSQAGRVYCDDCGPSRTGDRDRWTHGNVETDCIECGAAFLYYPSEKAGLYCPDCVDDPSVSCPAPRPDWGEGSTEVVCDHCSASLSVYDSKAENQEVFFCDRDCYSEWLSVSMRAGSERIATYTGSWTTAQRLALERDDHSCQRCGVSRDGLDQNPDVHHIIPARTFVDPAEANTLDNLVCLCHPCHLKVEWYGASIDDDVSGEIETSKE